MKKGLNFGELQGMLSLGYLFLIVMGIVNEALHYQQLGIDILNYSSILDVLISPIAQLSSSVMGLIFFLFMTLLLFTLPRWLAKRKTKRAGDEAFATEYRNLFRTFTFMYLTGIFGFFIGTGVGQGSRAKEHLAAGTLAYNDRVVFIGGAEIKAEILGKNSAYLFYVVPNDPVVRVSPLEGAVQQIIETKGIKKTEL